MNASGRIPLLLGGTVVAMIVLLGCAQHIDDATPSPSTSAVAASPHSPDDDAVDEAVIDKEKWAEAVGSFPNRLPDGYDFPESEPEVGFANLSMTGDALVYQWWGCATLLSAWSSVDSGDITAADEKLRQLDEAIRNTPERFKDWESLEQVRWQDPSTRGSGNSGLCGVWFDEVRDSEKGSTAP